MSKVEILPESLAGSFGRIPIYNLVRDAWQNRTKYPACYIAMWKQTPCVYQN
jgi:hypothetical protein